MKCKSKKRDGSPCGAWAVTGTDRCILHSEPDAAAKLGRAGGLTSISGRRAGLKEFRAPATPEELRSIVAHLIIEVRKGLMSAKGANAIAALGGLLLRTVDATEFESRLRAVEAKLRQKGPQPVWKTTTT